MARAAQFFQYSRDAPARMLHRSPPRVRILSKGIRALGPDGVRRWRYPKTVQKIRVLLDRP